MSGGKGIPPWHLWGSTQQIQLGTNNLTSSVQLARIAYKRPETWTFIFGFSMPNIITGWSPGLNQVVSFQLILGSGRSVMTLNPFVQLISATVPTGGGSLPYVWSSVALTSGLWTGSGTTPTQDPVTEFPAEDIQCSAFAQLPVGGVQGSVVEVTALFAPRTHVRPDWYLGEGREGEFMGSERGGR